MSLRTASWMSGHALDVYREHPRLLVFAALSVVGVLTLLALFLAPVLEVTRFDVWHWLWAWHPQPAADALREFGDSNPWWTLPLPRLAGLLVTGSLLTDFIQCALCSQSISALNGGRVSITRGFALAVARLPAIIAWTLFQGTVGVFMMLIGERFGFIRHRVRNRFGMSWGAAGVFVIPVMLNEAQPRSPVAYMKISASITSRMWGDRVLDMFGPQTMRVGPIVLFWMLFLAAYVAYFTHVYALLMWGGLILLSLGMGAYCSSQVYLCGLYIYATEGVLPGPFDNDFFRRTWAVRAGA